MSVAVEKTWPTLSNGPADHSTCHMTILTRKTPRCGAPGIVRPAKDIRPAVLNQKSNQRHLLPPGRRTFLSLAPLRTKPFVQNSSTSGVIADDLRERVFGRSGGLCKAHDVSQNQCGAKPNRPVPNGKPILCGHQVQRQCGGQRNTD